MAIEEQLPLTQEGGSTGRELNTKATTLTQIAMLEPTDNSNLAVITGRDNDGNNNICNYAGPGDDASHDRGKNCRGRGRGNKGKGYNRQQHASDSRGGTWGGRSYIRLNKYSPAE